MGIFDTAVERHGCGTHTIIEAHPEVYKKMLADGWGEKPNVKIVFGRWQDCLDQLETYDSVFFDTFDDVGHMREFHAVVPRLVKPGGLYSFFNGLCPENIIFQGVACEVIRIDLEAKGFTTEFMSCEVEGPEKDSTWEGISERYYSRSDYFLPLAKKNKT